MGSIRGKKLFRIDRVDFISINSDRYDGDNILSGKIFTNGNTEESSDTSPAFNVDRFCNQLIDLLSDGSFYFGYDWDCTTALQKSTINLNMKNKSNRWKATDDIFFWNHWLLRTVIKLTDYITDASLVSEIIDSGLFVTCFRGFAKFQKVSFSDEDAVMALLSRVGCKRAGMRFRSRGIDDDGNVSNFVETELIFSNQKFTFSYIIIRGTVPIFWEQDGFQFGFPRIQLKRSPAATQTAFDRHIYYLKEKYGLVHIIDLLGQKEGHAENLLSNAMSYHVKKSIYAEAIHQTNFDIYAVCKNSSFERLDYLFHLIGRDLQVYGYFVMDQFGQNIRQQKGVFRINCLDCLDRTNISQSYIVKRTVDLFIRNFMLKSGVVYDALSFQTCLSQLWIDNGDQMSRIYTASDAIKSSYGRLGKLTFKSFVQDITNNARRFYSNNFTEKGRQNAMDLLLGKSSGSQSIPYSYSFLNKMQGNSDYFLDEEDSLNEDALSTEKVCILSVTWNTGGALPDPEEDFFPLLSIPKNMPSPNLVVVAFQEIVELNASQIMTVDPEKRIQWEELILARLKNHYAKKPFSLLISNQLVGTTISVFIQSDHIENVRDVAISSIKTGMGGMAGNKGTVAVVMEYFGSTICFISSHFSAGQSHSADRDRDILSVINDLVFPDGTGILDQDVVLWLGDMNFRVEMNRDHACKLIMDKNFAELLRYDQLLPRLRPGYPFCGFQEAQIGFAPTYKYDTGTNIYDSSEKMRVPSWTDRVLFKGKFVSSILSSYLSNSIFRFDLYIMAGER